MEAPLEAASFEEATKPSDGTLIEIQIERRRFAGRRKLRLEAALAARHG
jgi:hypothetical protein